LHQIKEGNYWVEGRKITIFLELELSCLGKLILPYQNLNYLVKRITCNFISHLPANDNRNMCVGMEIRKTVSLKGKTMGKYHLGFRNMFSCQNYQERTLEQAIVVLISGCRWCLLTT